MNKEPAQLFAKLASIDLNSRGYDVLEPFYMPCSAIRESSSKELLLHLAFSELNSSVKAKVIAFCVFAGCRFVDRDEVKTLDLFFYLSEVLKPFVPEAIPPSHPIWQLLNNSNCCSLDVPTALDPIAEVIDRLVYNATYCLKEFAPSQIVQEIVVFVRCYLNRIICSEVVSSRRTVGTYSLVEIVQGILESQREFFDQST